MKSSLQRLILLEILILPADVAQRQSNGFVNRRLQVRIPPSAMDKSPVFMLVSGIAIHFSALCFATGWRAPEFAEVRGFPSESAKQNAKRFGLLSAP